MASPSSPEALVAAFFFGIVLTITSAAIAIIASLHGFRLLRNRSVLTLALFLGSAALWAQVGFLTTVFDTVATTSCQATVIFATLFDQLARVAAAQYTIWAVHADKLPVLRRISQGLVLLRASLGVADVAVTRFSFSPTCVPITDQIVLPILVIVFDVAIIIFSGAVASCSAAAKAHRTVMASRAVGSILAGLVLWLCTSIVLILGLLGSALSLRTTLPAIGLGITAAVLGVAHHVLVQEGDSGIAGPDNQSLASDSSSTSSDQPPSRYEDLKGPSGSAGVRTTTANEPNSMRGPVSHWNSYHQSYSRPSFFRAQNVPFARSPTSRASFAQRTAGVHPRGRNGLRLPPSLTGKSIRSGNMPTGQLQISRPIIIETAEPGVRNPLQHIETIDLATAAENERRRRAMPDPAPMGSKEAVPAPTASISRNTRAQFNYATKDVRHPETSDPKTPSVSEAVGTSEGSGSVSMEVHAASSALKSPQPQAFKRIVPEVPEIRPLTSFYPGEQVRVSISRSQRTKDAAAATRISARDPLSGTSQGPDATLRPPNTQRQETVLFFNSIIYHDPEIVSSILTPDKTVEPVMQRPHPLTRKTSDGRQVFPAGASLRRPRRSMSQSSPSSKMQVAARSASLADADAASRRLHLQEPDKYQASLVAAAELCAPNSETEAIIDNPSLHPPTSIPQPRNPSSQDRTTDLTKPEKPWPLPNNIVQASRSNFSSSTANELLLPAIFTPRAPDEPTVSNDSTSSKPHKKYTGLSIHNSKPKETRQLPGAEDDPGPGSSSSPTTSRTHSHTEKDSIEHRYRVGQFKELDFGQPKATIRAEEERPTASGESSNQASSEAQPLNQKEPHMRTAELNPINVAGRFHHPVGKGCPTFTIRQAQGNRSKGPPPSIDLASPTRKPPTIRYQEPSPIGFESPGTAYKRLQSQLDNIDRQSTESLGRVDRGAALLEDLEFEMDAQEMKWHRMQTDMDRASTSSYQKSSPSHRSSQSSNGTAIQARASQRDHHHEPNSTGNTLASPVEVDPTHFYHFKEWRQTRNNLSCVAASPAVRNDESLEDHHQPVQYPETSSPEMATDSAQSGLWIPKRLVGEEPPCGRKLWRKTNRSRDEAIEPSEFILPSLRKAPRMIMEPLAVESSQLWTGKMKAPEKSNRFPRLPGGASASPLWPDGSRETCAPRQPKVNRPVTLRPQRKSRRITSLCDIVECPEPLPHKRDTLGIFQFPSGVVSDRATMDPLPKQHFMMIPNCLAALAPDHGIKERLLGVQTSEQSMSFFDDSDEGDNIDDDDDSDYDDDDDFDFDFDDFDENTIWEIESLLQPGAVSARTSMLSTDSDSADNVCQDHPAVKGENDASFYTHDEAQSVDQGSTCLDEHQDAHMARDSLREDHVFLTSSQLWRPSTLSSGQEPSARPSTGLHNGPWIDGTAFEEPCDAPAPRVKRVFADNVERLESSELWSPPKRPQYVAAEGRSDDEAVQTLWQAPKKKSTTVEA